jgi:DNA topoisomerase-6 subunit B
LTTVKEAIDNSLDAAEEAGILPSVSVELVELAEDRFRVVIEDNGPGIVKAQVPKVFGKLLYGSKFHRLKMSRGQQGIGISAAGMYGQMTTGKPIVITSKTGKGRPAHHFEIVIDTARNAPNVVKDETVEWDKDHGTRVEIELQGTYKAGRRSVDEYIEQVGIANPHAEITFRPPKGRPPVFIARVTDEMPREPLEIQPHPYGVELGMLQKILQDTEAKTISAALQSEFSRVTPKVAQEILERAKLSPRARPRELDPAAVERMHKAIPEVKIFAPPSSCVVPIGEELLRKGLEREIKAEFVTSTTRPPAVYRGNPFQVEAGLAYGGSLRASDEAEGDVLATAKEADAQQGPITLLRLANRVPLQYQQSACAIFKAVVDTNWRGYGLTQPRGSLPQGPMVLIVHIASVWVPFTSESKEAVAHYPEILKEMQLALQDCGRKLGAYLRRREAERHELRRRSIFEMYIGELVESLGKLTPVDRAKLQRDLAVLARKHTGDSDEDVAAMLAATKRVTARAEETPKRDGKKRRAAATQLDLLDEEA